MTTALRDNLMNTMKDAMKSRDQGTVDAVRLIISDMKLADVNARGAGRDKASDAELYAMMQKMVKQRQESLKIYQDNARPELAAKESAEIAVIEQFLPKQMDDAATETALKTLIAESGAASVRDMGKVMALVKDKYAGQMDTTKASALVKTLLGG